MRTDASDGEDYTKAAFVEHYGGTVEWETAPRAIGVGSRIVVTGIRARPDLNGRSGIVLGEAVTSTPSARRWEVRVEGEARHKSLRPVNLIAVDMSSSSSSDDDDDAEADAGGSGANGDVVWTDDSTTADDAAAEAEAEAEAEQQQQQRRRRRESSAAARKLQAVQRGKTARRATKAKARRSHGAATRLQSAHRGRGARRQVAQRRDRLAEAQSKRAAARAAERAAAEEQSAAARALQSAARGRAQRKAMVPTHLVLSLAAEGFAAAAGAPSERDVYIELVRLAASERVVWRSEVHLASAAPEWAQANIALSAGDWAAKTRFALRCWDWDAADDAGELIGETTPFALKSLATDVRRAGKGAEHAVDLLRPGSKRRARSQSAGTLLIRGYEALRRNATAPQSKSSAGGGRKNAAAVSAVVARARPAGWTAHGGAHTKGVVAPGDSRVRLRLDAALPSRRPVFVALRRMRRGGLAGAAATAREGWTIYRSTTSRDGAAASWAAVELSLSAVCGGDVDWPLELLLCAPSTGGGGGGGLPHTPLARAYTTLRALEAAEGDSVELEPIGSGRSRLRSATLAIRECALIVPSLWGSSLRSLREAHEEHVVLLSEAETARDDARRLHNEALARTRVLDLKLSKKKAAHAEVAQRQQAIEDANAELALRCEELEEAKRNRVAFAESAAAADAEAAAAATPSSSAAERGYAVVSDVTQRVRSRQRERVRMNGSLVRPSSAPFDNGGGFANDTFAQHGPSSAAAKSARSAGKRRGRGGGSGRKRGSSRGSRGTAGRRLFSRGGGDELKLPQPGKTGVGMLLSIATGTACKSPRTKAEQQKAWQLIIQNAEERDLETFVARYPMLREEAKLSGGGGGGGAEKVSDGWGSERGGGGSTRQALRGSPHSLAPINPSVGGGSPLGSSDSFAGRPSNYRMSAPSRVATSGGRHTIFDDYVAVASKSSKSSSPSSSGGGGGGGGSPGVAPFRGEMALLSKIRSMERRARAREEELLDEIGQLKGSPGGGAAASERDAADAAVKTVRDAALAAKAAKVAHKALASELEAERAKTTALTTKCARLDRAAEGAARARSKQRTLENKTRLLKEELEGVRQVAASKRAEAGKKHAAQLQHLVSTRKGETERLRHLVSTLTRKKVLAEQHAAELRKELDNAARHRGRSSDAKKRGR